MSVGTETISADGPYTPDFTTHDTLVVNLNQKHVLLMKPAAGSNGQTVTLIFKAPAGDALVDLYLPDWCIKDELLKLFPCVVSFKTLELELRYVVAVDLSGTPDKWVITDAAHSRNPGQQGVDYVTAATNSVVSNTGWVDSLDGTSQLAADFNISIADGIKCTGNANIVFGLQDTFRSVTTAIYLVAQEGNFGTDQTHDGTITIYGELLLNGVTSLGEKVIRTIVDGEPTDADPEDLFWLVPVAQFATWTPAALAATTLRIRAAFTGGATGYTTIGGYLRTYGAYDYDQSDAAGAISAFGIKNVFIYDGAGGSVTVPSLGTLPDIRPRGDFYLAVNRGTGNLTVNRTGFAVFNDKGTDRTSIIVPPGKMLFMHRDGERYHVALLSGGGAAGSALNFYTGD